MSVQMSQENFNLLLRQFRDLRETVKDQVAVIKKMQYNIASLEHEIENLEENIKQLSLTVSANQKDLNVAYDGLSEVEQELDDSVRKEQVVTMIESALCSISPLEKDWQSYWCVKNECIMYYHIYDHYEKTSDRSKACSQKTKD